MTKTPFIIAWILIRCCVAFGTAPIVWIVPSSLLRVYPTDVPGGGTTVTINCARGEYCAFQVAVQAPAGGLANINFSVSNLTGRGRPSIPSTDLIVYLVQYITVQTQSPTSNGPPNLPITNQNTFPDPLVPFIDPATGLPPSSGASYVAAPTNLATGNNAIFVINTYDPPDTQSGF